MTSAAIKPLHDHKTGRGDFVICLGAGKSQLPLIVAAKKCGYKVVAVDQNPIAPGFQISDIVICQSTYKVDPIIKDLHAHPLLASSEQCRGILNRSSGWPVVTAASLCTRLNLPGIPERSAMAIVNKHLLRKHCSEEGLPSPKYEIYGTRELSKPCHLEFPLVVKPSLSLVGKSGVSVVDNKIALNDAMERAVRYTTNGTILVEEFLPGKDFCLVGFVQNTRVVPICLLEELNETGGDGKIYGKGFKTRGMSMDGPLVLDACSIAQKISDIFKIRRSPFMVSLRMDSYGKLNLIEIHLDIGGDLLIEGLFPLALPFDFPILAVGMAVGHPMKLTSNKVRPSAILYQQGPGLLTDRNYKVYCEKTECELQSKMEQV